MFRLSLLLLTICFVPRGLLFAQESDPIAERLEKAKRSLEDKENEFHADVLERLHATQERATKAGNKRLLDQVESDRLAFEKDGTIPVSIRTSDFIGKRSAARRSLVAAYEKAIADYTKKQRKSEADAVELELRAKQEAWTKSPGEWKPLFNGKDLGGWRPSPGSKTEWTVVNGILRASGPAGHLLSVRDDFRDFHLRVEAMINDGGNSGLFLRVTDGDPLRSYEVQIHSNGKDRNQTGSLFILNRGQGQVCVAPVRVMLVPPNTWFALEVIAEGNRLVVLVNGRRAVDYTDANRHFARGAIGLQQHHAGTLVAFRRIEIREQSGDRR